ncbi:f-box protein skip14 [Quercus suber]|uniref:F-box protein skip14 n=1 Tax=Quercus suber TaxID=58331 RepID=A0AAW0LS28_QUESU
MPLDFSCSSIKNLSELEASYCQGMDGSELAYGDPVGDDVIDKLPIDPFGMDIKSRIRITGWFQNLGEKSDLGSIGFGVDEAEKKMGDYHQLVTGLNWVWNGSMRFEPELGNMKIGGLSIPCDEFNGCGEVETGLLEGVFGLDGNVDEFMSFSRLGNWFRNKGAQELKDFGNAKTSFDGEGGAPHDAMIFALGYLGVQDLLNVERVCKSLRVMVRSDPLLWRSINIDHPLSGRITDDALLKLADRAQGTLQCLNLLGCIRITDSGLKRVLETNPRLTKLSVPGCVRLSADGMLNNLRAFKSVGSPGIRHLRIAGVRGVTEEQFKELLFLLNVDNCVQLNARKPQIYCGGNSYLSCDDDRAIDIEVCPKCQELRLVFDCPAETCQGKHQAAQLCRACILCTARCFNCGRCIKDHDYEETFCLDLLCLDCWKQLLDCEDGPGKEGSSKCTIIHQASYQFCFYG